MKYKLIVDIPWKRAFALGAKVAVAKFGFDLVDGIIYAVSKRVLKKMEKASREEAKDE